MGHLDKSETGVFDKTVGALSFCGGCDDIGFFAVDPSNELPPHEFLVEVGVELAGESTNIRAELGESVDDLV